ncbi:hypothetical protein Bca52824_062051, partial [Brassica carinata]
SYFTGGPASDHWKKRRWRHHVAHRVTVFGLGCCSPHVVINNIDISIQRIAQVVVLDPPPKTTTLDDASLVLDSLHTMLVFPTYDLMMMTQQLLAQESKAMLQKRGLYIFQGKKANFGQSLLNYRSCAQVIAMEPSNERFLRVNHYQTALVLGGTVSSGLPLDLLVSRSKVPMPLQEDAVNVLASVLSPPLCPSALSSKLRVAVLLHGLPVSGIVALSNLAKAFVFIVTGDRVGVASEIASVIRELTEPVSNGEYSSMEEESNDNSVLNSDSEESLPEDDPDSVVVEYVDFIKAMDQLSPSLSHK